MDKMITLHAAELGPSRNYYMLISALVPRPIAWVSSCGKTGENNLAPFSFYGGICGDPPLIGVGIARQKDGRRKDTAENILQTEELVIHLAEVRHLDSIAASAGDFPPEVSEAKILGLKLVQSQVVAPMSLDCAPFRLECRLHKHLELGNGPVDYLIAEVLAFVLPEAWLDRMGRVKQSEINALGRMGGNLYVPVERFMEPRG
ncbi:MAG: flavin reductase family protein [Planctomycetes bacterium]|nr:flavin reductase family protein [Planctomycetota bacterium]